MFWGFSFCQSHRAGDRGGAIARVDHSDIRGLGPHDRDPSGAASDQGRGWGHQSGPQRTQEGSPLCVSSAGGLVQELSLSGSQWGNGAAGRGESGVPLGGELFPRVGFLVTNLTLPSRAAVRFYNKRGAAEQWIKEGKQAVKMTRLSCHRFRSNEVRLWLTPSLPITWATSGGGCS